MKKVMLLVVGMMFAAGANAASVNFFNSEAAFRGEDRVNTATGTHIESGKLPVPGKHLQRHCGLYVVSKIAACPEDNRIEYVR